MRRLTRFIIVLLSWCALLALLASVCALIFAGRGGRAYMTAHTSRAEFGIRSENTALRTKVTFISYQMRSASMKPENAAALFARLPGNWPALGTDTRSNDYGLLQDQLYPSGFPDRVSGWDLLGIGFEDRYHDWSRVSVPYFDGVHQKTWYCATIWPALLLVLIALPAILRIWATVALLRRARRNQKAHHQGLCPGCRYDIRATPERCPECGRVQYPATKMPLHFSRRMTWLIGGGLLIPAVLLVISDAICEHLQDESWLRDHVFRPAVLVLAIIYWFAILTWAVRHIVNDLRRMVQVYGEPRREPKEEPLPTHEADR